MGEPAGHWKASEKAGKLMAGPFTRNLGGEWGSVKRRLRIAAGVNLEHQV